MSKSVLHSAAFICAITVFSFLAVDASAQAIPKSDPGQIQKRFEKPVTEAPSTNARVPLPSDNEGLSEKARAQLDKKQFTLKSVSIEGATIYSKEELQATFNDKIGQKVSLADLQDIAKSISDRYRKDGYTLSQAVVPQQNVSSGKIKIRVVEGFVGNIIIEGDISASEKEILRDFAEKITSSGPAGKPVSIHDLERYMLLMNDLPGSTVSGLLKPSASNLGSADLVLTAKKKAIDASYTFDNRGSKFIGPYQHSLTLAANSLFNMYDRTQFRFSTVNPVDDLQSYELSHEQQIGSEGTKASIVLAQTNTAPQDTLAPLNIEGNSMLYSAKVSHPLIRQREENLQGRFQFDARDTETNIFGSTHFSKDRVRTLRAGATYNRLDNWRGNNLVDVQISQGLDIFDATTSGTNRSNANGDSTFTKFNADISRTQSLPYNFSIFASGAAQYSDTPLLVSEQFGIGGQEYGQAFDPSELLGDQAVAGKVELRYNHAVGLSYFEALQGFTYYDVGKTWTLESGPGANENTVLESVGFGVRTSFTENLYGSAEAAFPLTRPTVDQTAYRNEPRVFFSVTARY